MDAELTVGILMWEIFTCGDSPYGKLKNAEVVENVCNRKYRLQKPADCPDSIYKIMLSCWKKVRKKSDLLARFLSLRGIQYVV